MKIELSRHLGYCFGVRRAMDLAFQSLAREAGPVYSHGPLIHNEAAGRLLSDKGLRLWPGSNGSGAEATVIIRAHGLPPKALAELKSQKVKVVDATCPRVLWVQRLVSREAEKGATVLIWGAKGHPEVEGLLGYAQGLGVVISGSCEVAALPDYEEVFLVAQTTQDLDLWPEVRDTVIKRFPGARVHNTICGATVNRQKETKRLCLVAGALVVVGGKESGNTQRLADIGRKRGLPTLAVEGPEDITADFLLGQEAVAVAAGASTPVWQIRAVLQKLQALERDRGNSPPAFFSRLFRALALSNIYVGLGAGALGFTMAKWAGIKLPSFYFGLYFFYVQAMHLLNGFLDRESARYNDPDRAAFLAQYRLPLVLCGVLSLFLSLSAANLAGPWVLAQLLTQSALGLAYAMPWPFRVFKVRRLSDLPLSKTLSTALGWAALLTGPAILASPPLIPRTGAGLALGALLAGVVFLNVLTRTMIMDLQEALGDQLFGQKSVATILGRAGAIRLLAILLVVWAVYLMVALILGGPLIIWWLLIFGPIYNALILRRHWRGLGLMGFKLDLLLDAQFLYMGLGLWLL